MHQPAHTQSAQRIRGFTLIELIMVIVMLGALAGVVAVFIRGPIDAYLASARRATMTDEADTVLRRIARDVRRALPNTLRQSIAPAAANTACIEFIPTKTGGRYRVADAVAGDDSSLDFSKVDSSFHMLGNSSTVPAAQQIAVGDTVAVYNLGIDGANAYAGDNTAVVSAVTPGSETVIAIGAGKQFPLESGSNRFHVIDANETIVSYVCSGGKLWRNTNYGYNNACSTTGATLMAQNVSACNFVYNAVSQRNATLQLMLQLSQDDETVSLYHEVHVSNTP